MGDPMNYSRTECRQLGSDRPEAVKHDPSIARNYLFRHRPNRQRTTVSRQNQMTMSLNKHRDRTFSNVRPVANHVLTSRPNMHLRSYLVVNIVDNNTDVHVNLLHFNVIMVRRKVEINRCTNVVHTIRTRRNRFPFTILSSFNVVLVKRRFGIRHETQLPLSLLLSNFNRQPMFFKGRRVRHDRVLHTRMKRRLPNLIFIVQMRSNRVFMSKFRQTSKTTRYSNDIKLNKNSTNYISLVSRNFAHLFIKRRQVNAIIMNRRRLVHDNPLLSNRTVLTIRANNHQDQGQYHRVRATINRNLTRHVNIKMLRGFGNLTSHFNTVMNVTTHRLRKVTELRVNRSR